MGRPLHRLAVTVIGAVVVLAGCIGDPTRSAEYESVVAERDEALALLDTVSNRLDDVLIEVDQFETELANVQHSLDDMVAESAELTAELRAAETNASELQKRVTALEPLLEANLLLEIDQEVERVCSQIVTAASGDAVTGAALLISFDPRWEPYVTPGEVGSRVGTCAGLDYLSTIALGSEFGNGNDLVHKWATDVRILVTGSPTGADIVALDSTIADLNRLIDSVAISRVVGAPSEMTVHFIPVAEFEQVLPQYVPGNDGFVWISWNYANEITAGTILIRADDLDQAHRSHLVREEVTQAFGLMNDSFNYEDSIFQQSWTAVTDYAAIDEVIIDMLYRPEVLPGMTEIELRLVFDWQFGG